MFGYNIVKTEDWEKYYTAYWRVKDLHRWLSGFDDLDVVWEWLLSGDYRRIDVIRNEYAKARGTDVYGCPIDNTVNDSPKDSTTQGERDPDIS